VFLQGERQADAGENNSDGHSRQQGHQPCDIQLPQSRLPAARGSTSLGGNGGHKQECGSEPERQEHPASRVIRAEEPAGADGAVETQCIAEDHPRAEKISAREQQQRRAPVGHELAPEHCCGAEIGKQDANAVDRHHVRHDRHRQVGPGKKSQHERAVQNGQGREDPALPERGGSHEPYSPTSAKGWAIGRSRREAL